MRLFSFYREIPFIRSAMRCFKLSFALLMNASTSSMLPSPDDNFSINRMMSVCIFVRSSPICPLLIFCINSDRSAWPLFRIGIILVTSPVAANTPKLKRKIFKLCKLAVEFPTVRSLLKINWIFFGTKSTHWKSNRYTFQRFYVVTLSRRSSWGITKNNSSASNHKYSNDEKFHFVRKMINRTIFVTNSAIQNQIQTGTDWLCRNEFNLYEKLALLAWFISFCFWSVRFWVDFIQ